MGGGERALEIKYHFQCSAPPGPAGRDGSHTAQAEQPRRSTAFLECHPLGPCPVRERTSPRDFLGSVTVGCHSRVGACEAELQQEGAGWPKTCGLQCLGGW